MNPERAPAHLRDWERAEIVRSASEARHSRPALKLSARNIARYMDPPAATAYPLEYVYHLLGPIEKALVLDLGCGSGVNSLLLAFRGARPLGVDISEDLLRLANARFAVNAAPQPGRFLASSAHALPLPDASVDCVLGVAILHHLDLTLVRDEVLRILKPGGHAIFQEPVRNSRIIRVLRALIPYRSPDVSPFERPLFDSELNDFAKPFSCVESRSFGLPHVKICELVPWLRRYQDAAYNSDAWLLRTRPWLSSFSSIRVLRLTK